MKLRGPRYDIIRNKLPHVKLVQVIHVIDEKSVNHAVKVSKFVDALLPDSGNPNLPVKELGGTGRTHDWEISRYTCKAVDVPVFLAGGINKDNVRKAIEIVKPYGIDLCSSVRTAGKLNREKLAAFFKAIEN